MTGSRRKSGKAPPESVQDGASRTADRMSAKGPDTVPPAAAGDAKSDEHVGKMFGGKYRIDRLIAKGGMGRVYRGTQFPLERPVAIKILNKEFQRSDPQFVRRFFLEASTAAKLSHPHSITVFDYGESDGGDLFIAMEYLRGRPLSRVITADGPFSAERALRISLQVCRALREAHVLGIIHRDLKPGNIFLVDEGDDADYAKVLDFGLVKLFRPEGIDEEELGNMLSDGDGELTRTGTLLGSPKYMSPEQIQGKPLDPRTDIYSFGVIIFQMIAGKPPYTGATGVDVIYKHVHEPIPAIADVSPGVECPPAAEALIRRCLAKSRDERYASMDELIVYIKDALRMVTGSSSSSDSLAEVARMAQAARLTGSPAPPPPAQREASFREHLGEEPTPMGQLGSGPTQRPSRVPLAVSAIGFVLALITLAYVTVIGPRFRTTQEPAPKPTPPSAAVTTTAPREAQIEFSSDPTGAQVSDGDSILGTTPFARTFTLAADDRPHRFLFKRPGYKDTTKTVKLGANTPPVEAQLEPVPAEEPEQAVDTEDEHDAKRATSSSKRKKSGTQSTGKPNKKDSLYRRNPY